ncbi:MAG: NIPSNAP family protein [Betaproteobacteria bacterium]|nr:NIPSNAP family protein [Betaproteobacteria bacterium]MBA3776696.1 NIPSNAP family protein [Betaproteobacteria bacterium]
MHRYEVATITIPVGATSRLLPKIGDYLAAGANGKLCACWYSDIGALNQIMVIREFASDAELIAERGRMALAGNPFGIGEFVVDLAVDSFTPFPFLPPLAPGDAGPFYEVRAYTLRPSALAPMLEAWRAAIPARIKFSPLAIAMYAVEGAPRFMHAWPYQSLNERQRIRTAAVAAGVWPPKGGQDHLLTMRSSIFLAAPFSPLK